MDNKAPTHLWSDFQVSRGTWLSTRAQGFLYRLNLAQKVLSCVFGFAGISWFTISQWVTTVFGGLIRSFAAILTLCVYKNWQTGKVQLLIFQVILQLWPFHFQIIAGSAAHLPLIEPATKVRQIEPAQAVESADLRVLWRLARYLKLWHSAEMWFQLFPTNTKYQQNCDLKFWHYVWGEANKDVWGRWFNQITTVNTLCLLFDCCMSFVCFMACLKVHLF